MPDFMLFIPLFFTAFFAFGEGKIYPEIVDIKITSIIDPIEQMPTFPGGEKQLYCFLDRILDKEKLESVEVTGNLVAQFTIDTTGNIKGIRILKKLHPVIDQEFARVIRHMPKWEPGKLRGKTIEVKFTLPLKIPYENRLCKS